MHDEEMENTQSRDCNKTFRVDDLAGPDEIVSFSYIQADSSLLVCTLLQTDIVSYFVEDVRHSVRFKLFKTRG